MRIHVYLLAISGTFILPIGLHRPRAHVLKIKFSVAWLFCGCTLLEFARHVSAGRPEAGES